MARIARPHKTETAASPARARTGPSGWIKLALAVFGCVMALALSEIAVRVLRLGPDTNIVFADNYRLSADPRLAYELVPGSVDGSARISSAGLRDREYAPAKPPGVFRVVVIGDSIAYGFGIPQSDALSKQLEELLQSYHAVRPVRVEVLNLGVSGYNIDQIVENLRTRGLRWQPDLIVYAYCLNDPQVDSFELASLKAKLSPAASSYRDALLQRGRRLFAHSQLLLLARFAWQKWSSPQRTAAAPQDEQWQAVRSGAYAEYFSRLYSGAELARLQQGIARLRGISRDSGVPLVSVVFPLFLDLGQYHLAPLHSAVSEAFRSAELRSYDLLPLYATMFRTHGPSFVLNALHPNALGVRLAALYLIHAWLRDGVLPAAAQPWTPQTELAQLDALLEGVVAATDRTLAATPAPAGR
jgi:lysophospholipase L1-like esterase